MVHNPYVYGEYMLCICGIKCSQVSLSPLDSLFLIFHGCHGKRVFKSLKAWTFSGLETPREGRVIRSLNYRDLSGYFERSSGGVGISQGNCYCRPVEIPLERMVSLT